MGNRIINLGPRRAWPPAPAGRTPRGPAPDPTTPSLMKKKQFIFFGKSGQFRLSEPTVAVGHDLEAVGAEVGVGGAAVGAAPAAAVDDGPGQAEGAVGRGRGAGGGQGRGDLLTAGELSKGEDELNFQSRRREHQTL